MMDFTVFDSFLDAIFVIDREKKILYRNESFSVLCDLTMRKIPVGTLIWEVIRFKDEALFCTPHGRVGESEATPYHESVFTSASGREGRAQISVQPFCGAWIIYLRDVTLEESLHKKYRSELAQKENALKDLQVAHGKLEDYAKNLEKKVEERTLELKTAHELVVAILDSLGQGILIFDREGSCQDYFSKASLELLECAPAGKPLWEVLRSDPKITQHWCGALFDEKIPFDDVVGLGPGKYPHRAGKEIQLQYFPKRTENAELNGVVLVATDRTEEREARKEAEKERNYVQAMLRLVKNRSQFISFIRESRVLLDAVEYSANQPLTDASRQDILRALHTLKGGASTFFMDSVQTLTHGLEEVLLAGEVKKLQTGVEAIRNELDLFFKKNEEIIGQASDDTGHRMVFNRDALKQFFDKIGQLPGARELQEEFSLLFLREPIRKSFEHYQPMIQDLAQKLGKHMLPLCFSGGDLRISAEGFEELFATFVHAIRNSVVHGIQSPQKRIKNGKSPAGRIEFRFSREEKIGKIWLLIQVIDDGEGIDPARIRSRIPGLKDASDEEVLQHIFDPGFTTADGVSLFSGRGVGVNAIKVAAEKLNGSARIVSMQGKGTVLEVRVEEP